MEPVCLFFLSVSSSKVSQHCAKFCSVPGDHDWAESTSLVIARGTCIPNAEEVDVPIKLYCNGTGVDGAHRALHL